MTDTPTHVACAQALLADPNARHQLPVAVVAALVMNPNTERVLRDHQGAIQEALARADEARA